MLSMQMGTLSTTHTPGRTQAIYYSSISPCKLDFRIQQRHPGISTRKTDPSSLPQTASVLRRQSLMAHAGRTPIRMIRLGFPSRPPRQRRRFMRLCRDSWELSHSTRGRDFISQLVSGATFIYRQILTFPGEESYGGHYGPVFAEYIEARNAEQRAGTIHITLETVTIINGWMNPLIQV